MEVRRGDLGERPGCSRPAKACAITLVAVVALFLGLMFYAFRMPVVRGVVRCQTNMREIGDALRRYNDVNRSYPRDLESMSKDYLKDPSVLRCPLDRSPSEAPSYIYHRPDSSSPGSFVVLECRHHDLGRDLPPSTLVYMKNGTVKTRFGDARDKPGRKRRARQ